LWCQGVIAGQWLWMTGRAPEDALPVTSHGFTYSTSSFLQLRDELSLPFCRLCYAMLVTIGQMCYDNDNERKIIIYNTNDGDGASNCLRCVCFQMTHHLQYPPNTSVVYSYFESRGGKFDKVLFFGLQYILKRWLVGSVVTQKNIDEAKDICRSHYGQNYFNEDGWKYIVEVASVSCVLSHVSASIIG